MEELMKTKTWTKTPNFTHAGQKVTQENVHTLPPGSVVRLPYDKKFDIEGGRLIHLHDGFWLWCDGGAWCYGGISCHIHRIEKGAVLCHLGMEVEK
jgi:hypothetical protein